jgi:hypothetical protein
VHTQDESSQSAPRVRGLVLPALLAELLASGQWQHPGDEVLHEVLPWFEDPVDFLSRTDRMERESRSLDMYADDEPSSRAFLVTRGSIAGPVWLPWLDAELAVLIAVNRHAGDDIAIALDYRNDAVDPAVVASDAWTWAYPSAYLWRPVAPTFEAFAAMLGIKPR